MFWEGKISRLECKIGQLVFSESNQQLGNSAYRILFPKIFCGLNFQLKNPNRSVCISSRKYAFKKALKQPKKAENDVSSILLKFCCWVPLISLAVPSLPEVERNRHLEYSNSRRLSRNKDEFFCLQTQCSFILIIFHMARFPLFFQADYIE